MIREGDRLLLGVSGGKDSLTLLHCLLAAQRRCRVKFTLACATVDPQVPTFVPSALQSYIARCCAEPIGARLTVRAVLPASRVVTSGGAQPSVSGSRRALHPTVRTRA
jgi:tRNA(Ile)-lysidine synthase TilS/MesJ